MTKLSAFQFTIQNSRIALPLPSMKLSLAISVFIVLFVVQCSLGSRVKKQNLPQNDTETAVDRPTRDSRKYLRLDGYGSRHEEFESHKQRPSRFKGRRRPKPSTTTAGYDYGDYDESSKEVKSGFEEYFKNPYVGNVGKIFNQKDINDYFLKGNGDYSKLVQDVLKNQPVAYFEDDAQSNIREDMKYKTIVNYDKKDSSGPSYNYASKETPSSSYSYETKDGSISSFNSKNKDIPVTSFKYSGKDTSISSYNYDKDISSSYGSNIKDSPVSNTKYGNKDISFSSFNYDNKDVPITSTKYGNKDVSFSSFNYENKDTVPSYGYGIKDASISNYNYHNKDTPSSDSKYGNKDTPVSNFNYGKDASVSSYSYGNKDNYATFTSGASDTMTSNGWSAMVPKYTSTTTTSPFDYSKLYGKGPSSLKDYEINPLKTYASDFSFDSKPLADVQPTRYTFPFRKYTVKNTDYVSEFDSKGNPISSSSSEASSNEYIPEKDYEVDFTKSFYDYNRNKKPMKVENFFDYNNKKPSDSSYGWDLSGKGYASNYDYFGKGLQAEFLQRYPEFAKYALQATYKGGKYGSVEVPQPIIVPVPQPYPVKVPIAKPVAVPILKEIKVPIEKVIPYPVIKNVPYPVEKHVPVPVEKKVPVPVPQPYPVKIPVFKNVYHHAEDHEEPMPKAPSKQRGRGRPRGRPNHNQGNQGKRHQNRHHQNRHHQDKHRDQFDDQDEIHEQYEEYYHEEPHHHRGHHHHHHHRYDRFHDRRRQN